jgi:hypothetical protein
MRAFQNLKFPLLCKQTISIFIGLPNIKLKPRVYKWRNGTRTKLRVPPNPKLVLKILPFPIVCGNSDFLFFLLLHLLCPLGLPMLFQTCSFSFLAFLSQIITSDFKDETTNSSLKMFAPITFVLFIFWLRAYFHNQNVTLVSFISNLHFSCCMVSSTTCFKVFFVEDELLLYTFQLNCSYVCFTQMKPNHFRVCLHYPFSYIFLFNLFMRIKAGFARARYSWSNFLD